MSINSNNNIEIIEALKQLSPSQMAYFKELIFPIHAKVSNEKYSEFIADRISMNTNACPRCSSSYIVKNGRNRINRQRYKCKSCGKNFSDSSHSPLRCSKKSVQQWLKYMKCMANGLTIRNSAEVVGIHRNTAFYWRHKILNALKSSLKDNLSGIVEIDEVLIPESFKGNHSNSLFFYMYRKPRQRGATASEYTSLSKIRVLCCKDRSENIFSEAAGKTKPNCERLMNMLKDKLTSGSTICTNNNMSYLGLSKKLNLKLYKLNNYRDVQEEIYHNQNARAFGLELKSFISFFHGVATKYLNFYVTWLKWMNLSKVYAEGFKAMDMFLLVTSSKRTLKVCDLRFVHSLPEEACP